MDQEYHLIKNRELINAALENNLPELSRLLSVGADVNGKYRTGYTPLHWASIKGYAPVVKELLDHGANIEAIDKDGDTPLHFACYWGHVAVGNELRSRGANIEAKNDDGDTPLHCAAYRDHLPVIKALLRWGANILAANNNGRLPLHLAVSWQNSAVAKYLLQMSYATTRRLPLHELVEDLTWIGDPIIDDSAPPLRTALHKDVLGMDDIVEILEYLVSQNHAWISSRDEDGSLPLHLACRRGAAFSIVQSLLDLYKASVKSVTPGGDLPLFLACDIPEPSLDTIFILMKQYPDVVYHR
jgi:ankyrin repeat protein